MEILEIELTPEEKLATEQRFNVGPRHDLQVSLIFSVDREGGLRIIQRLKEHSEIWTDRVAIWIPPRVWRRAMPWIAAKTSKTTQD